jgi:hypothetical protein
MEQRKLGLVGLGCAGLVAIAVAVGMAFVALVAYYRGFQQAQLVALRQEVCVQAANGQVAAWSSWSAEAGARVAALEQERADLLETAEMARLRVEGIIEVQARMAADEVDERLQYARADEGAADLVVRNLETLPDMDLSDQAGQQAVLRIVDAALERVEPSDPARAALVSGREVLEESCRSPSMDELLQ